MSPATPAEGSTHSSLLAWATAVGCASLDAQLLLAHALDKPRSFLYASPEQVCAASQRQQFIASALRRARGEPLAYITGQREFWSLPLAVNAAVLVPRPETELLVERALALCAADSARALDLGTGSGAIALAIAHERPRWQITATDASAAALQVAAHNAAQLHCANVEFLHGSWFGPLAVRHFDLILSNPPYIAPDDAALADQALGHEPRAALVSAPDGLTDLRHIVMGAGTHLLPGGWLLLEHGSTQAPAVAEMLVKAGYAHVRCHADLAGLPRVTEARKQDDA